MSNDNWISVKDKLPELIGGRDYSENVLVINDGRLGVMCYAWNFSDDDELRGYYWANCYGDIYGEGDWDDNYYPTHWQPLPEPPKVEKQEA